MIRQAGIHCEGACSLKPVAGCTAGATGEICFDELTKIILLQYVVVLLERCGNQNLIEIEIKSDEEASSHSL